MPISIDHEDELNFCSRLFSSSDETFVMPLAALSFFLSSISLLVLTGNTNADREKEKERSYIPGIKELNSSASRYPHVSQLGEMRVFCWILFAVDVCMFPPLEKKKRKRRIEMIFPSVSLTDSSLVRWRSRVPS